MNNLNISHKKEQSLSHLLKMFRSRVALTQKELAGELGVTERVIRNWENGLNAPKADTLKHLIEHYLRQSVFLAGKEGEEVRQLWQTAKSLFEYSNKYFSEYPIFDERWFDALMAGEATFKTPRTVTTEPLKQSIFSSKRRIDWGEAPCLETFYGREKERAIVSGWIVEHHCRLVALVGIGGIGKTTLTVKLIEDINDDFDFIIWRSLQNTPTVRDLIGDCLDLFSAENPIKLPVELHSCISLLINYLRNFRCLLILDNFESVLQPGDLKEEGYYRKGFEGYGKLLSRVAETGHRSCLIITSREKPYLLRGIEGTHSAVRSLSLPGLEGGEARKILEGKSLAGPIEDQNELVSRYSGNPLALKFVSETIRELFNSNIAAFLNLGRAIFGDIRRLLDEQFARLSPIEKELMFWLAIEREPVSLHDLVENLLLQQPTPELLEALGSLKRRSLVETSEGKPFFTQQPVVIEYVSEILSEMASHEIKTGEFTVLCRVALLKAQAKEHIRSKQFASLLKPLLDDLRMCLGSENEVENHFKNLLHGLKEKKLLEQGYAPGNIINLICQLRGHLNDYDLSGLNILQAYLQGIELHNANFAYCNIEKSTFAETFNNILSLAFSPSGQYLAVSNSQCEVRVWRLSDNQQLLTLKGHTDWVETICFSPDGMTLASGSHDHTIKLWSVRTGKCLNTLQGHSDYVYAIAFSPDGKFLASGGKDLLIRLWDTVTGLCVRHFEGHTNWVWALAFSPTGEYLASGSQDSTIKLWNFETGVSHDFAINPAGVKTIGFSPDGQLLASGGLDRVARIWEVGTGDCLKVLRGHTGFIHSLTFNPAGQVLATGSEDKTIRLWEIKEGSCLKILQGHQGGVNAVDFGPDGTNLASGSQDQTVKLWDIGSGICSKTWHGYSDGIKSIAISPDGKLLASGGDQPVIKLWDIASGKPIRVFQGHSNLIWSVNFSPDGRFLISTSHDRQVKLWVVSSGEEFKVLDSHPDLNLNWMANFSPDSKFVATANLDRTVKIWELFNFAHEANPLRVLRGHKGIVWSVAFSPQSHILASASDDGTARIWNYESGECLKILEGHQALIWTIAFSPDGKILASGSDDQTIRLWDVASGDCCAILYGHTNRIRALTFSPDGKLLASGGFDKMLRVWEVKSGRHFKEIPAHTNIIYSIAFNSETHSLISASEDGTIKFWSLSTFDCFKVLKNPRPYERMTIAGLTGLTPAQLDNLKELGALGYNDGTETDSSTILEGEAFI